MSAELTVLSFGFSNGCPDNADTVIDVRGVRNPFYEPGLREMTGLDSQVKDYIFEDPQSGEYLASVLQMLDIRMSLFRKWTSPNRHPLTIAVGCTGGRHRSVAFAEAIAEHFKELGYSVRLCHRDLPTTAEGE